MRRIARRHSRPVARAPAAAAAAAHLRPAVQPCSTLASQAACCCDRAASEAKPWSREAGRRGPRVEAGRERGDMQQAAAIISPDDGLRLGGPAGAGRAAEAPTSEVGCSPWGSGRLGKGCGDPRASAELCLG